METACVDGHSRLSVVIDPGHMIRTHLYLYDKGKGVCVRDVCAIYDNNISPSLLMIIIKIIILYFIQIRHTDAFPPTGTLLVILTDDLSDDCNMLKQRGICYARSNSLIRNFSLCSPNVKVKLFKAFCCIMYCCQIWSQYKKDTVRKLQVGYNHAFRRIMKYDRTCSASGMFVANGVMSFNELWRKSL